MASWRNLAWAVGLGVLFGLLCGGAILLAARPPRGDPVTLLPPPEPPALVVQVSGQVPHPGLVSLPPGSRVADALEAAGGVLPEGEAGFLNLAAPLEDGQLVNVPAKKQDPEPSPLALIPNTGDAARTGSTPAGDSVPEPQSGGLININTAPAEELDLLPGIGPVIAQRIIDYREQHGPFQSIEDIQEVKGIGEVTFEKIKDRITTGL